jgi:HPt (histidine-containing phosphotransfer) domain-containing protein
MGALRERFRARAGADRVLISTALAAGDRHELRRLAHGLSGSGGVFGFPEVSAVAEAVETAVEDAADQALLENLCHRLLDRLADVAQRD